MPKQKKTFDLFSAIDRGHFSALTTYLTTDPTVDLTGTKDGFGLLHKLLNDREEYRKKNKPPYTSSFLPDSLKIAKLLLKNKLDVNFKDKNGNTPLHLALSLGEFDIAEAILEYKNKIDFKATNHDGESFLHCYLRGKQKFADVVPSRLKEELFKQVNINMQDAKGMTVLHLAISYDDHQTAGEIVSKNPNVNLKDTRGYTPLHSAVTNTNENFLKLLLEKTKPNFSLTANDSTTPGLGTAIQLASQSIDSIYVNLLLPYYDLTDPSNAILLHAAATNGNADLVKELLARGMKISDINGRTPILNTLHLMEKEKNYRECFDLLFEHEVKFISSTQNTLLHKLAKDGFNINLLSPQQQKQLAIFSNSQNNHAQTPLHLATNHSEKHLFDWLLKLDNLKTDTKDTTDLMAMDYAIQRQDEYKIQALKSVEQEKLKKISKSEQPLAKVSSSSLWKAATSFKEFVPQIKTSIEKLKACLAKCKPSKTWEPGQKNIELTTITDKTLINQKTLHPKWHEIKEFFDRKQQHAQLNGIQLGEHDGAYFVGSTLFESLLSDKIISNDTDILIVSPWIRLKEVRNWAERKGYGYTENSNGIFTSAQITFPDPNLKPIDITCIKSQDFEENLLGRDFTMNAIALQFAGAKINPDTPFRIITVWEWLQDLVNANIRCIDLPEKSFKTDPVRKLRGIALEGKLNDTMNAKIEAETKAAIKSQLNKLANPIKLFYFLEKIFASGIAGGHQALN